MENIYIESPSTYIDKEKKIKKTSIVIFLQH